MSPSFSIIIPVYNVAPYLRECLDSVLAQTFTDWEAICVDDGSTDGSGAILDEYAARDKRFKVIHQSNAGVSAARNKGLLVVSATWLCFLDGDDMICKGALKAYSEYIQEYPRVDAFFFPPRLISWRRNLDVVLGSGAVTILATSPNRGCNLLGCHDIGGQPFLRLLRTSKFRTVYFPVGVKMMEDELNRIHVLAVPSIWAMVDIGVYCYRERLGSASRERTLLRCEEVLNVFKRIVIDAKSMLGCGVNDFLQYWKNSKGVLHYFLDMALSGTDAQIAHRCAELYFEIENLSGMAILDRFMRKKALFAISTPGKIKYVKCIETLYHGLIARCERMLGWLKNIVEPREMTIPSKSMQKE